MKKIILSFFVLIVIVTGAAAQAQSAPVSAVTPHWFVIKADGKIFQTEADLIVEENAPGTESKVYINPNWIDTIEVLKGQKATDEYGARGEKGVVVITLQKEGFNKLREQDKPKFKSIP
jgi:hypothetical protein